MMVYIAARFFHTGKNCFASEKSLLGILRKKTGYTFANCKKALDLHHNDLNKAEEWLQKQAQSLGWSKATKLEGRQTSQGIIGVLVQKSNAALVEVNCETDFVARNEKFLNLVENSTNACIHFINSFNSEECIIKEDLDSNKLRSISASDGKSLADHLALMIGSVGENANLRRAICVKVDADTHISGYAHPNDREQNGTLMGKYAALLMYKTLKSNVDKNSLDTIGKQLCQHVVGMNPIKIGIEGIDKRSDNSDDETCLIYQEYLLDPSVYVQDILKENKIEVVDFVRYECGENITVHKTNEQKIENIETCQ